MRCIYACAIDDVADMFVDVGCMCIMYAYMLCHFLIFMLML